MAAEHHSGGGASDEAGGEYRRGVAALFAAYGLNGIAFPDLPLVGSSVVIDVALETDDAVDDIVIGFASGRIFVQAKRSLTLGRPLREAVRQWVAAVGDPDFDRQNDIVAVASGSLTGTADDLRQALVRFREAGALSRRQANALEALRRLIRDAGANAETEELVLRRAHVMRLEVEEHGELDAARGTLLLDGHVVSKGAGATAWAALLAIAGRAARLRVGRSIDGWLEELRKRQIPLTADADASRAAYLEARRKALHAYRKRIIERGERIDLTGLGATIPPIPLSEVDAGLEVFDPDEGDRTTRPLLWPLRRRGRVLLTGLPGGGKSVAMAVAAASWARHDGWTTPIAVSLRRLADAYATRDRPLRERILDLAVESLSPRDRRLVRDALDQALERGEATLYLDGLDEAADRRLPLTREIAQLLEEVHPDTDVVVATRDIAYAGAHALLDFRHLRLAQPQNAARAVSGVLAAIADSRNVSDAASWVRRRETWVNAALARDGQLKETPLLPVLLTLLAADSDTDHLPETRATILACIVEDIVRRHEMTREVVLGPPARGYEPDVLLDAFPLIARVLSSAGGTAERDVIAQVLAQRLHNRWGLAPGPADVTARQILVFWDESGVFVAQGQRQLTSPRLQLLLEIGTAMDAAANPGSAAVFVEAAAREPSRREAMILAAGLSPEIAESLVVAASESAEAELAFAAAKAIEQGARVSAEGRQLLAERLIRDVRRADRPSWRAATCVLRLSPLPEAAQDAALRSLTALPYEYQVLGRALAALNRDASTDETDELLEQVLRLEDLPKLERPPAADETPSRRAILDLSTLGPDQIFVEVRERAAERLLPRRSDLAPIIAAGMQHASVGSTETLARLLERFGHGDLARRALNDVYKSLRNTNFLDRLGDMDREINGVIATVASLGESTPLSAVAERRLSTVAAFLQAVNYNQAGRWPQSPEAHALRADWFRLVAQLGGLDLDQLASEASVLLGEIADGDYDPLFSLLGIEAVDPVHWELVDDADAGGRLAVRMLGGSPGTAAVAAGALAEHPRRELIQAEIRERFAQLRLDRKRPAVWAYLRLSDDVEQTTKELVESDDLALRAAVAGLVDWIPGGQPRSLAITLAHDDERQVQLALLEQIGRIDSPGADVVALVDQMANKRDGAFTCFHCGAHNEGIDHSCQECNVVTEGPAARARALLSEWQKAP